MPTHCFSDLKNNQLSSIPAGLFDSLTKLQYLSVIVSMFIQCFSYLNNNQLSSIPVGLFDKLTKLDWLWVFLLLLNECFSHLNNNQLSSIPAGLFDKPINLHMLWVYVFMHIQCFSDLGNNQLSSISAGIFDSLTNLLSLWVFALTYIQCFSDLDNNQLSSIPAGFFDKLTKLQYLWVVVLMYFQWFQLSWQQPVGMSRRSRSSQVDKSSNSQESSHLSSIICWGIPFCPLVASSNSANELCDIFNELDEISIYESVSIKNSPLRVFRRIPLGHIVRASSRERVFLREMWRSFLASWHVLQRESEIRWSRHRRDWVKPVRKCLGWDGKLVVWVNSWPSELCDACGKVLRFFCAVQGTRHSPILQTLTDYLTTSRFWIPQLYWKLCRRMKTRKESPSKGKESTRAETEFGRPQDAVRLSPRLSICQSWFYFGTGIFERARQ